MIQTQDHGTVTLTLEELDADVPADNSNLTCDILEFLYLMEGNSQQFKSRSYRKSHRLNNRIYRQF